MFYGFGNFFINLTGFLLIPFYTKVLTVEEYGIFSLITVFIAIITYVYDFGIPQALVRYYYDSDAIKDKTRVISTALWFFVLVSALFTIFLIFNAGFLTRIILREDIYFILIQLAVLSVFFNNLASIPVTLLRINEKSSLFMAYSIAKGIALILLNFLLLIIFKKGLLGAYQALVITAFLSCLFSFIISPKAYSFSFSGKVLVSMLKYGIPFLPVMIMTWIIDSSNRFFIGYFCDIKDVGIYSLGCRFAQIVYMAIIAFSLCWAPLLFSIVKERTKAAPDILAKLVTYILFGFMVLVLLASIFNKELIMLMVRNPSFYSAYKVLPIVAMAYFFFGMYSLFFSGLMVAKKIYQQPIILSLGAIINIILNFILIPKYKMVGAGISMLLSYFFIASATYKSAQKEYFIPYEIKKIASLILIAILIFTLGNFVNQKNIIFNISMKVILVSFFPLVLFLLRFFSQEELIKLKLIFARRQ